MNMFNLYFDLGIEHITDIKAYDHILFLVTLCGVYVFKQWKQLLILITAFTIGHTLSLLAAVLDIVSYNIELIEFLIPCTVFITSFSNLFIPSGVNSTSHKAKYVFTLVFGLIHGLGFSNYLRSLLDVESIAMPLFSFNVGLEAGQLLVVLAILLIQVLFTSIFKVAQRDWTLVVSGIGIGVSSILMLERWMW